MKLRFAEGCAWHAFYIYGRDGVTLRFSLGIDPTFNHRPCLFGAVGFRKDCQGGRRGAWHWSLPLWRSRHWWRLDGRYGWWRS